MTDTHDDPRTKGPPARRVEIFTGAGRRRSWSAAEKARIVAESVSPGANVSAVARAHGLTPAQIFRWRRRNGTVKLVAARPALSFAPVVIGDTAAAPPVAAPPEAIEIAFKGVKLRIPGGTQPTTIMALLKALRPKR
jgi:transposase